MSEKTRVLTCVYCGQEYPQDTPTWGDKILTDHIKVCPKHPMRKAESQIAKLRAALIGLVGDGDKETLQTMKDAISLMTNVPTEDKINTMNAIDALLETMPEEMKK